MKPITIDAVKDVGHLCNLLRSKNVLALTSVTVGVPSENGSCPKTVTVPSLTPYIDAQQRTVLIQQGQCFRHNTKILGFSLILYDPTGSRVYQEEWRRNGTGFLEPSRNIAKPTVVAKLPFKSQRIVAWRPWLLRIFTNNWLPSLSSLYAADKLP